MFGGADLRQMRLVLGLLVVIFGSAAVVSYFDRTTSPAKLGEQHLHRHPPGRLIQVQDGNQAVSTAGMLEPGGRIDVNTADENSLTALPGIGPARAQAIVMERTSGGPFRDLQDLERVPGIGPRTVQRLTPFVALSDAGESDQGDGELPPVPIAAPPAATPERVRVNYANATELQRLTRVGPVMAQRIIDDRQRNGIFTRPEDMLRVSGIGPAFLEANFHLLAFD